MMNCSIKGGVKMEPVETELSTLSTVKLKESFSSQSLNIFSPSPYITNVLHGSEVFGNIRPTLFSSDQRTVSASNSYASPLQMKQEGTIRKVSKRGIPKCSFCKLFFEKRSLLVNHRIECHNYYPKKCLECGKPMKKYKKLRKHMRQCHPDKLISCDVCGEGFIKNKDLKTHYKRTHQGKSTRGWYDVPIFEDSTSSSDESKKVTPIVKIEHCDMKTAVSKDKLCLSTVKVEPTSSSDESKNVSQVVKIEHNDT